MAAQRSVLLSGEHPTLPAAELRALLDVHDPAAAVEVDGLVAWVRPGNAAGEGTDAALARMALAHEWGEPVGTARPAGKPAGPPGEPPGAALDAPTLLAQARGWAWPPSRGGPAAVAAQRRGGRQALGRDEVERVLGQHLVSLGHRIDLRAPRQVYYAWLADGAVHVGLRRGVLDRSAHEGRVSDERAHFSPVSMHPRRAASLLHLARVQPGGTVLDPFCGTGGLVLEAALEGYRVLGSDLDAFMVQGTLQTLADAGPEPLAGEAFVADVGEVPSLVEPVDGVVTDFPYGRASGTNREGLESLYGRALAAIRDALKPGSHAVVGHPLHAPLPDTPGLAPVERHEERVHGSLTRVYSVLRKDGR